MFYGWNRCKVVGKILKIIGNQYSLLDISDADLVQLLPAGHSVGSIRTRRPLIYIFSGGNEDAAFFSVNGFSILLDGGDQIKVPYWNLIRNYDKSKYSTSIHFCYFLHSIILQLFL